MNEIEKTLLFNNLLSLYEDLLTPTQKEILCDYYEANLSISEIAEDRDVSRAAIEDAIKKGNKKLLQFEKSLKLLEKKNNCMEIIAKIRENSSNKDLDGLLDELERNL